MKSWRIGYKISSKMHLRQKLKSEETNIRRLPTKWNLGKSEKIQSIGKSEKQYKKHVNLEGLDHTHFINYVQRGKAK